MRSMASLAAAMVVVAALAPAHRSRRRRRAGVAASAGGRVGAIGHSRLRGVDRPLSSASAPAAYRLLNVGIACQPQAAVPARQRQKKPANEGRSP
jgi:hypothetical protein